MRRLGLALLAGVAVVAPMAAQAAVQGQTGTLSSLPILALSGAGLSGGSVATLTGGTIYNSTYNTTNVSTAPANMTTPGNYLSAGPGPNDPQPNAKLTFVSNVNYVSFLWGSPDTYNSLSITSTTGTYSFTAAGLGLSGISSNGGNAGFSQYVQFYATSAGEKLLSATFSSSTNAFETADFRAAAVPGPIAGAGIPALMALGGALFMRRRKQA